MKSRAEEHRVEQEELQSWVTPECRGGADVQQWWDRVELLLGFLRHLKALSKPHGAPRDACRRDKEGLHKVSSVP